MRGERAEGPRGPPAMIAGARDPRLHHQAGPSRAQSPGPTLGLRGPASALSHSEGTLVGSPDLRVSALGSLDRKLAISLCLSHLHGLLLPHPAPSSLGLCLSVSDAGVCRDDCSPLSGSLMQEAPAAFLTACRLDCACQVGGRCPLGSWGCRWGPPREGQLSREPTGAVTGQAGAVSRHDLGHPARPGRAQAEGMNSAGKVARFSK